MWQALDILTELVDFVCAQKEEERLRASIRRDNQKRRLKERAQHRGLSSSYLEGYEDEEDEEDGLTSISAIKRNYKEKRDSEFWGKRVGGTFAIGYQKHIFPRTRDHLVSRKIKQRHYFPPSIIFPM